MTATTATEQARAATVIRPGEGTTFRVLGLTDEVKLSGDRTNQAYSVVEALMPPGLPQLPLHTDRCDENFYVVRGTVTFQLGEEIVEAPAGTFVHIPSDLAHSFLNAGEAPAALLGFFVPGGHDRYFQEMADLMGDNPGPAEFQQLNALSARYGTTIVGPPLSVTLGRASR